MIVATLCQKLGQTAAMLAAWNGQAETVQCLRDLRADLDAQVGFLFFPHSRSKFLRIRISEGGRH